MSDTPDIGRIVSLIMENPRLIEEISSMAKADSQESEPQKEETKSVQTAVEPLPTREHSPQGRNRSQLLGALKPYVSRERAQAIDSMLSIVEILDAMKGR